MGLFCNLVCERRLPDGWKPLGHVFQSKDFDELFCQTHVIKKNGELWLDNGTMATREKAERPYPDAPEHSFMALIGCMKWISKLEHASDFTGVINFYSDSKEMGCWVSYDAVYRKGKLIAIDKAKAYGR